MNQTSLPESTHPGEETDAEAAAPQRPPARHPRARQLFDKITSIRATPQLPVLRPGRPQHPGLPGAGRRAEPPGGLRPLPGGTDRAAVRPPPPRGIRSVLVGRRAPAADVGAGLRARPRGSVGAQRVAGHIVVADAGALEGVADRRVDGGARDGEGRGRVDRDQPAGPGRRGVRLGVRPGRRERVGGQLFRSEFRRNDPRHHAGLRPGRGQNRQQEWRIDGALGHGGEERAVE